MIGFWYRQHQDDFVANAFYGPNLLSGQVTYAWPFNSEPGMIRMILDARGKLFALEARPQEKGAVAQTPGTFDWSSLFAAAGLDPARFTPATPERTPPMALDARMAWAGTYAESRTERLRVEAASWQGRPVYFNITGDWPGPDLLVPSENIFASLVILLIMLGAASVAWNNLRLGRGDRRGAAKLATLMFVIMMCAWAPVATHFPGLWEIGLIVGERHSNRPLPFG